jgi:DNA-binding HxlR family transcriptional regulator
MPAKPKKFLTLSERSAYHSLEDVVGCKWSAGVVAALSQGVHRPGALERYIPGISTKVLNERLRKLLAYGLITREESAGLPAHVEYHLSPSGVRLAEILGQLRVLNGEHQASLGGQEGGA